MLGTEKSVVMEEVNAMIRYTVIIAVVVLAAVALIRKYRNSKLNRAGPYW
jgi:heme/copper-type cytochrome/quinol oxidase subunit 2